MAARKINKRKQKGEQDKRPPYYQSKKWQKIILILFSVMLYVNTLGHQYTQDDAIVIYDNMFTQQGLKGIPGLLTNDTFYGFFKEEGKANLVSGGRYRPLTPVMFAVEYAIFGDNPFIGHFFNIFYYALLAWILYLTLNLLLKKETWALTGAMAWVCCMFYMAHPVHTEVVANIKGRDEIISMLGSVAALYAVLRHHDSGKIKWFWLALVSFFLALMSKENAITYLAVLPLALILFRKTSFLKSLKLTTPLFISSILFLIIRSAVLGFDFGGSPDELMNNPFLKWSGTQWVAMAPAEKMATILFTLGKYLLLLLFPHPLSHDYYPRAIEIMTFSNWQVWLSLASYICLIVMAVTQFRKRKYLSFGILYFIITLSIVSNIIFPIGTNMSERFLFMPSLGFALVLAFIIFRYLPAQKWAWMLSGLILLGYSYKTITRNAVWKDDYTLFTSDVSAETRSAKLLNAAAGAISNKVAGMPEGPERTRLINQAIDYLKKAIDIHPTYRNAYLILGNSCYYAGRYDEAIAHYEKCLRISPGYAEVLKNLPIVLREAAKSAGQDRGDYNKAESLLLRSLSMQPNDFETNRLLGITYGIKGQHGKAIEYFNKALELNPNAAVVYASLGTAYLNLGDRDKANQYFAKAQELDPNALNHLRK